MVERRKHKRVVMNTSISAKSVGEIGVVPSDDYFVIDIFDISAGGIGFHCNRLLPLDSFYDASIELLNGEKFNCTIKVVRGIGTGSYTYGAEFISLPPTDQYRIDIYTLLLENDPNYYQNNNS